MNTQCAKAQAASGLISQSEYASKQALVASVQKYQGSMLGDNDSSEYGECPEGMEFGSKDCNENTGLCYDTCADGYYSVSFCSNGAQTCGPDKIVYACRAGCPKQSEGLGPWAELNADPLFTCEYKYPNGIVPSDPNLWKSCPEDGRFFVLQSSPTDVSVSAADARREPLCVRKMYLRNSACPNGFNIESTGRAGVSTCIQACNSDEIVVTLPDGNVVCQSGPSHNTRHDVDLVAVANSHQAKGPFKHRVLRRKNFKRSLGTDPNQGLPDNSNGVPKPSFLQTVLKFGLIFAAVFVVLFVVRLFAKKKPKK